MFVLIFFCEEKERVQIINVFSTITFLFIFLRVLLTRVHATAIDGEESKTGCRS